MTISPLNAQRLCITALAIAIAFGGFTMVHAQVQASDTIHLTGEIVSVDSSLSEQPDGRGEPAKLDRISAAGR
ncbi:hypothetical protein EC912_10563 [Luteibacter rhizovicinus]|uniref:Uncharacterized protein n=1 Tax=Luteibacter rhizovicinus TaxID=242606 RepID=A0A4R3YQJ6_9GAMM|nr:hypothetical protein [Luteibacter rhizovicinus]TCV93203.1 hypothetical protein EC912_10563 [Luteibacter rhizovicinus]